VEAIVAVLNKEDANAAETAISMLNTLKHRSTGTYGIASATRIGIEKSIELLKKQNINSPVAVGYAFSRRFSQDRLQPTKIYGATSVFEGRLYPASPQLSDAESVAERLKQNREKAARTLIQKFEGDFAFVVAEPDRLIAGRDPLGVCPLYYGESKTLLAIASERKALWKIGIKEAVSFPPGNLAVVDKHGFKFKSVKRLVQGKIKRVDMQNAIVRLRTLLQRSTRERILGLKEVAVAFSGGLDSSLIAFLAQKTGVNVHLIFVSLENRSEIECAKKAAEALKLPIHVRLYKEKDVEKALPRVLWLIEEPAPVKASIGIPFYWAAENAAKMELKVMLAGQGADELFGGYKRYLTEYLRQGKEKVREAIFKDIVKMHETNFERDRKICGFHNVELRLPFATCRMVEFALTLPLELKIESSDDAQRKLVLRWVAKSAGLPEFIANKPKKAIQYSTGVSRTLKKLAKRKGLSQREYVSKVFDDVSLKGDERKWQKQR
jgi:asparagine synthetase B (glutamine-hydrolysing)